MESLQLLPVGNVDHKLLKELCPALEEFFGVGCRVLPVHLDPQFAFHGERQQYHSSEILLRMQDYLRSDSWRILGVASGSVHPNPYIRIRRSPDEGALRLLSGHRLRQEFYGLPANKALFKQRLIKEAAHELGHTLDLLHCDDYRCTMASSHAVEWIDLKEEELCTACRNAATAEISRLVQPTHGT
jgi:Predicted Zn-dependent proteases